MRVAWVCLVSTATLLSACSPKGDEKAAAPVEGPAASVASSGVPAPARKPGLWEIKSTGQRGERVNQICLDEATDRQAGLLGHPMGGRAGGCPQTIARTAAGYTIDSSCKRGGGGRPQMTVTNHAVLMGDFSTSYSVSSTTTMDPPRQGMPGVRRVAIAAKWLGQCAADQKPGDVILPDGASFNIADGPPPHGPEDKPGGGDGQ